MTTIKFTEISKLKDEIDRALDESNFEELNNLSNSLFLLMFFTFCNFTIFSMIEYSNLFTL